MGAMSGPPSKKAAMSGPPSKKAAMSGPPSKSGRRPRAAVGLAGADLAVLEDELRAGVDDGGPVGEGLLRPLAVGAGLVVEVAVGVHAAQEHRGLAVAGRPGPGGQHLDQQQEAAVGAEVGGG